MKVLVIHQVPFRKINYHLGIDHQKHQVTYVGYPDRMSDLPVDLPCQRLSLEPGEDLVAGVCAKTSPSDGYEKVLSLSEFGILEAWQVRKHLEVPGPSRAVLERVRDKVTMKQALAQSGVRCPRFVSKPDSYGRLPWSGKTVIKPRLGASSNGVRIYQTAQAAVSAHARLSDPDAVQIEEYIDGAVLHADALVDDGKVMNLVTSRYVGAPVDFANGYPFASYQVPSDKRYEDFTASVVRALGITEGCLHLEFFETKDAELVFLEVANRLGGAGIVTSHYRHTGVHLPSHEIAIRLGWSRPAIDRPSGRFHGFLLVPGHGAGSQSNFRVQIPEHLRDSQLVDQIHQLDAGAALPDEITYQEWLLPLFVEASHEDSEVLGSFLRKLAASITFQEKAAA